jgi:hypothetical protein
VLIPDKFPLMRTDSVSRYYFYYRWFAFARALAAGVG